MAIKQQKKLASLGIIPGIALDLNPFSQRISSARILRNLVPEKGRLIRKSFSANYTTAAAASRVWRIVNFRYTDSGGQKNELIIFRANGKVYKVTTPPTEVEIFPAATGFAVLGAKPFVGQISNRLVFSDGSGDSFIYNGTSVVIWGMARSTSTPAVSAVAGSLTAATGLKACITWVELSGSTRVHESSRSNISAFQVLTAQNLRIDKTAMSAAPARATHWSAYVSELDGSNVLRRAATTAIATDTVDISALPAATSPKAPIRNDTPPATTVGEVSKNRYFVRDDANQDTFYFSALGEVKGLLSGAPDESFPGQGANTLSDIVNSDFVPDREIRSIIEHENVTFLFTERRGFALIGELNLLDDRISRNMVKIEQFTDGAVKDGVVSTPYGLCWFTPGKKVFLWAGGRNLFDIGEPIQLFLDQINSTDLDEIDLGWWDGGGRQWLILVCRAPHAETNASTSNRIMIYDFSLPSPRPDRPGNPDPGSWFEWTDIAASAMGVYLDVNDQKILLIGDTSGNVKRADTLASGAVTHPEATLRTGLVMPEGDSFVESQYLSVITGFQDAPGAPGGTFTEPTITSWVDPLDVNQPGTGIALTLDTAITAGDRRAWLIPETGGVVGGAFGKQFIFQAQYPAGQDQAGNINAIYKMALSWKPKSESSE